MKQEVIREMSTKDLQERLEEERAQFTKLRLTHAISPLENPHQLAEAKKGIARMLTELTKRGQQVK
jgi:large subunit ribosomal protein L29